MLLNLIFPDDCLASPLGVKIWLECGSLLWTAHGERTSLGAGKGEYTLGSEQQALFAGVRGDTDQL